MPTQLSPASLLPCLLLPSILPPAPASCPTASAALCRNQSTMINSSRVLLLAMLSTASGWGLPSHDPLLSWNETGGVDGARDQRQLQWHGKGKGDGVVSRQPPPRALALWPVPVHLGFIAVSAHSDVSPPSAHRRRGPPALGLRRRQTLRSVRTRAVVSLSRSRRLQTSMP